MRVKLLAEGGSMKPGPALSQKIGPLGININEIIKEINEATKNFEGLKVPVELDVDSVTKDFEIKVFSPPVSELLKRELGVEKGSGMQEKIKVANASIEQIISVAKTKLPNMLCKDLKSAVKSVVGTCISLGVLIENQPSIEIEKLIDQGKFDREIKGEITITPAEKKAQLQEFFSKVKENQDRILKEEAAAKEAEAAKAEVKEGEAAPEAAAKEAESSKTTKTKEKTKEEPAKKK
ncbi:MAG: 50S ribosomal protein L11 [Nanoarchaeota archaeon]|nr:50S ribosomal protein L11 [Nanoarchaeota archaeon]